MFREAKDLYEKKQYRDAEQRSRKLFEVGQHSQDTYCQALALLITGHSQEYMGQYQESLRSFEDMLSLPQNPRNEKTVRVWAYNGIGIAYKCVGRYETAIEYANKALDISQKLDDKSEQGTAYCNLGIAFEKVGRYEEAAACHKKHLEISRQLHDTPGQGRAYCNLGCAYEKMGQYRAAIRCAEEHFNIAQQLGDELGRGHAYCNLGIAYQRMGQYTRAIQNLDKHLDIAQKLDDKPGQGLAYYWLGNAYRCRGKYKQAVDYAEKELCIVQQLNDKPGQGHAYTSFGNAYYGMRQYKKAIKYHRKNLEISVELKDKSGQGKAYGNLACAYSELGESKTAIKYGEEFLRIAQQLDDRPRQRLAHGNLGLVYARCGQFDLARQNFEKFYEFMCQLEVQLADGKWRLHLLTFGENHVHFMDEWVVAAARSGNMEEALRVEDLRRCRSELAYQADVVQGRQDVSLDKLKAMARSAGAAFVIVMKMFDDTLLTWVLSGESGELLYTRQKNLARKQAKISKLVNCVTFAEWERWQKQLVMARESLKERRKEQNGVIPIRWLKSEIETLISEDMKGDLNRKLWRSMRDPKTFERVVTQVGSPEISELHKHFLQKAERAMDKLNELLWKPIERCTAVKTELESETRCDRPVSGAMRVGASDPWGRLISGTALDFHLGVETDLLFARPFFVANSLCCVQSR